MSNTQPTPLSRASARSAPLAAGSSPAPQSGAGREDLPLFDFETGTFEGWRQEGESAFGPRPAEPDAEMWKQLAPHQLTAKFTGWQGRFMVHNNIWLSEKHSWRRPYPTPAGRLISPEFKVERSYMKFQFGGILNPGVRVELWANNHPVRVTHGQNHFDLTTRTWDVREFAGRTAHLAFINESRPGERVLFRADTFVLTDVPAEKHAGTRPTFAGDARILRPGEFRHVLDSAGAGTGFFSGAQLVRAADGWHLFAVEQKKPGTVLWGWHVHENDTLYHSSAPTLSGPWSKLAPVFTRDPSRAEQWLQTPAVAWRDGRFVMLCSVAGRHVEKAPENDTWRDIQVVLATSSDGRNWTRQGNGPVFTESSTLDGMTLLRQDGRWMCFYASILPDDRAARHPKESLVYRTSDDLLKWSEPQVAMAALPDGANGISNGQNYLFQRAGYWYLVSHRASPHWERTRFVYSSLWRSRDLRHWDIAKDYQGMLNVWGSPAAVTENGKDWFILHWHLHSRGAWLAPIDWHDEDAPWGDLNFPPLDIMK